MGKPKTNPMNTKSKCSKSAKSKDSGNPFAVKKTIKKAKKKIKPSLELVDKTFGDLRGHRKMSTSAKKSSDSTTAGVHQEHANKLERTARSTANLASLDQLVNETAHARI